MLVDQSKSLVFVWVPGTGGHEVHPAFKDAVASVIKDDYQIICVQYSAEWDFSKSVPDGERALKDTLRKISLEITSGQRVFVAGSSQGSWVISDVYNNTPYVESFGVGADKFDFRSVADKTVIFGHPGISDVHDHQYENDDSIWEINDTEHDAVTFGWSENHAKIIRSIVAVMHGKVWRLPFLLWLMLRHPKKFSRLLYLILYHAGIMKWNTSPHDYSRQMPLAVYWLVN